MIYVQVLGGFVLLLGAAEVMVRGAVALADRLGISKMVIGMTVVAVGTSAPELVVGLDAALSGAPGLAVGNVVGSNIANVLLVLGGAGVVRSLQTKEGALHVDCGVLFGGTILFIIIAYSGTVGRLPGVFLLIVFFGFLWNSYRREKGGGPDAELHEEEMEEIHSLPKAMALAWGYLIVGIAGIILGADLLVDGGVQIARNFGVSDEVIGLTLFAVGTSLPELGASVVAAYRGHTDVAIGNVVGSNVFNILGIAGTVALVSPLPVAEQIRLFDNWVMLAATVLVIPLLLWGWRINRPTALVFLVVYGAYVAAQAYGVFNVLGAVGIDVGA